MTRIKRGESFTANEPTLTQQEVRAELMAGKNVVSFKGQPVLRNDGIVEFIAVKLALATGKHEIVFFDRFVAEALMALFDAAKSVNWNGNQLAPETTRH